MTRKERVMAVINGQKPDRIPSGFWLHFPADQQSGDAAYDAHMRFFEESGTDICKVMNEDVLRSAIRVQSASDFGKITASNINHKALDNQVALCSRIVKSIGGDAPVLATIHGVVVSTHHSANRVGAYVDNIGFLRNCLHEDPAALRSAMQEVTQVLCELTTRLISEAGIDGIYYAALGAEKNLFSTEQYLGDIAPLEKQVFAAAKDAPCFNALHICKNGLDITRFADYPAQLVNWAIHENNPTLEEGFEVFKNRVILGGLDDRAGVLVDGTEEEIRAAVRDLLRQVGDRPFILGSDCTLPTEIDTRRIRTAVEATAL